MTKITSFVKGDTFTIPQKSLMLYFAERARKYNLRPFNGRFEVSECSNTLQLHC